jgi:hypothetical protein
MKTYKVSSSAIEKIAVSDNVANITFNNGREYTYEIANPDWVSALESVIADPEGSVGKFVNRSIREDESLKIVVTV